jgi:lipoprotein-releasing system permease protein
MQHGGLTDLKSRGYGIAIGVELASKLGVYPGDKVTLITPHIQITPAGLLPRMKRFTVTAIYRMNMKDYDSSTAFIHIDDAARLLKTRQEVTGIRLKLDDLFYAPQFAQQIEKNLGKDYKATDWAKANQVFFAAVKMERIAMFIILSFIVLIAAFYLLASLVMIVTDKQADIAILRTLGMPAKTIRNIFIIQGSLLGIIGTLLGGLFGIVLSLNIETLLPRIERLFNFEIFPADVYYIAYVPSDLHANDVWIIMIGSILMSILATIPASRRAAAIQPVEALRYD